MQHIDVPSEIIELIARELGAGRAVDIPGLGVFSVEHRPARIESADAGVRVYPPSRRIRYAPPSDDAEVANANPGASGEDTVD
jgi:hypothetical protein